VNPYVVAAYAVTILSLLGYGIHLARERKTLLESGVSNNG